MIVIMEYICSGSQPVTGKPAFYMCENNNRAADQRSSFRYINSTIPLLPKSKISSLQPGLCNPEDRFSHDMALVIVE